MGMEAKASTWLTRIGLGFFLSGIVMFLLIFFQPLKQEFNYFWSDKETRIQAEVIVASSSAQFGPNKPHKIITPVDPYFSLIIPKINANSKVIENVDPYIESEYQYQLSKGVAHAKGTALPGAPGNAFLFAHSAGDFYKANQYNAVFYLLNKLEKGDKIYTVYYKQKYVYKVKEVRIVPPESVKYLKNSAKDPTLTLMTCTPAGTTLNRLLVVAELVENEK